MAFLLSVNVGARRASAHSVLGVTGIDKRPVAGPVEVRAPGPKGVGGSGLSGDDVCDLRHHGGNDQAVYAFARRQSGNDSGLVVSADAAKARRGGIGKRCRSARSVGNHWCAG